MTFCFHMHSSKMIYRFLMRHIAGFLRYCHAPCFLAPPSRLRARPARLISGDDFGPRRDAVTASGRRIRVIFPFFTSRPAPPIAAKRHSAISFYRRGHRGAPTGAGRHGLVIARLLCYAEPVDTTAEASLHASLAYHAAQGFAITIASRR